MNEEYEEYVVVQKNRTLSEIVFEYYGNLDFFEEVLEINIGTIDLDVFLKQGTKLNLPVFEQDDQLTEIEASTLW